jgi:hypothetical protein
VGCAGGCRCCISRLLRAVCADSYVTEGSGRPWPAVWRGTAGLLMLAVVVAMAGGSSTAAWGRPVRAAGGDLGGCVMTSLRGPT